MERRKLKHNNKSKTVTRARELATNDRSYMRITKQSKKSLHQINKYKKILYIKLQKSHSRNSTYIAFPDNSTISEFLPHTHNTTSSHKALKYDPPKHFESAACTGRCTHTNHPLSGAYHTCNPFPPPLASPFLRRTERDQQRDRERETALSVAVCTTAVHVCALKYNHLQEGPIYSELAVCAEMQPARELCKQSRWARPCTYCNGAVRENTLKSMMKICMNSQGSSLRNCVSDFKKTLFWENGNQLRNGYQIFLGVIRHKALPTYTLLNYTVCKKNFQRYPLCNATN